MNSAMKTYTPKELPAVLHLGMTTIYRMLRTGEIPSTRVGEKKIVVTQETIEKLLDPKDIRMKRKRK